MENAILYIWLSKLKGIGPVLSNNLINYFGKVGLVYEAVYEELLNVDGIGPKSAKIITSNKSLEISKSIYEKCKRLNIQVITRESENYPKQLRMNSKAPLILYVRGNLKLYDDAVCIVGSRRCTEYGKNITIELSTELSNQNIPIISGMAKGIDGYSHTVALYNNNYTIAVLGTGVDKCYPSEHITLMDKIIESGAVISQFEPGISNIKTNFLKRNELMAMLSKKVVVVEASKESGALYTAHCGVKYGKEVYAVPGNINSKCSEGTNLLISEGIKPYLSTRSIIKNLVSVDKKLNINRESKWLEEKVINIISKKALSIDAIKLILKLDDYKVEQLLFEMEAQGQVVQTGGVYSSN